MNRKYRLWGKLHIVLLLFLVLLTLVGCEKKHKAYVSTKTSIRDNTPECLVPEASGVLSYDNELVNIDVSNAGEGYIMVTYLGDSECVKLQITGPDYMTYTYDLNGNSTESFPLSTGSGDYTIGMYEQIEGTQYSTIFSENIYFEIVNQWGAFLYPNQYVKFDKDSEVVAKGMELVKDAHDDLEAINYVYNYLVENVTYDKEKAENVQSGYIPDVDEILNIKTGICLDYAAVMTSMLRSQKIPTRMEVGYAGNAYHAWISTYVDDIGWLNGIVEFDGVNWSLMDPTVAASSGDKALKKYIGDKDNTYMSQFTY